MSAGLEPTTFGEFQRKPKTNALPLRQDTMFKSDLIRCHRNFSFIYQIKRDCTYQRIGKLLGAEGSAQPNPTRACSSRSNVSRICRPRDPPTAKPQALHTSKNNSRVHRHLKTTRIAKCIGRESNPGLADGNG